MRVRFTNVLLAATTLFPVALAAQGVVVHSTTDTHFYGGLGAIASFAAKMGGGKMTDITATTSVAGHKMRSESSTSATIIDADAGRFTHIDHKAKTYTTMTFAELAAAMRQAVNDASTSPKASAEQAKDPNAPKGDVKVNYTAKVDRPGEHKKIAGYDAERVFVTITMEAEAKPEGEKAEQVGSMVFLLDQWRSTDAPQLAAMEEFQRAYVKQAGEAFRPPAEALSSALATHPEIKEGFEASAKELAKVPGVSLRSATYVALVPAGMTFDRQLVLNDASAAPVADAAKKEEKPKGGFGGLMGALKSAAQDASKKSDNGDAKAPPKQTTLMSVVDEVKSIETGSVPASTFEVPAGYREIKRTAPSPK